MGRPAETDSDETRQTVLEAAKRIFAHRGYSTTTLRSIAQEANVTHGSVYHHYRTKRQIFLAVETEITTTVHARLREAFDSAETFEERWGAVLDAAVDFARTDRPLAEFIATVRTEARRHPEIAEAGHDRRWLTLFGDLVDIAVTQGLVDVRDRTLAHLQVATVFFGLIQLSVDAEFEQYRIAVEGCKRSFPAALRALGH